MILRHLLSSCSLLLASAAFAHEAALPRPVPAPPPAAGVPEPDALRLAGGDELHGCFGGYSVQNGLVWRHPEGLAPLQFAPGSLDCIELHPPASSKDAAADMLMVFTNGDSLAGKLVEYTPKQTVVETPSGRFAFDSAAVRALAPVRGGGGRWLDGIGREEDWKMLNVDGARGTMKIADGKMILSKRAVVTREAAFGAQFRLELEFEGAKGAPVFGFLLDTDDEAKIKARKCSFYAVSCHGGGGEVMRVSQGGKGAGEGFQMLGQLRFQFKPGVNRLAVAADANARTLTFFLNEKQVGEVKDPGSFLTGKYLVVGAENNGDVTITGLSLTGGQFTGGTAAKGPAAADQLLLANQDQASGQLLFIRDGKASFKTDFATLEIPLERIATLALAHSPQPAKPAGRADAMVFFQDATRLTLHLESAKEGEVTGHSEVLGDCRLRGVAVQKIVFNLSGAFRKPAAPKPEPKKQ